MASQPLRIAKIQQGRAIVDSEGRPTPEHVRYLNDTIQALSSAVDALLTLPGIAGALGGKQDASAVLTGLSALPLSLGAIEQTALNVFNIRQYLALSLATGLAATPSYANDAAAAAGGVAVDFLYRTGSSVMVRVV